MSPLDCDLSSMIHGKGLNKCGTVTKRKFNLRYPKSPNQESLLALNKKENIT